MENITVNELHGYASSSGNVHQNNVSFIVEPDPKNTSTDDEHEPLIDGLRENEHVNSEPSESGSDDEDNGDDEVDVSDIQEMYTQHNNDITSYEQVPMPPTPIEGGLYSSIPFFNTINDDVLIDSIDIPKKDVEYIRWFDNITRRLISPTHLSMTIGYQPSPYAACDAMEQALEKLRISQEEEDDYDAFRISFGQIYNEVKPYFRANRASSTIPEQQLAPPTTQPRTEKPTRMGGSTREMGDSSTRVRATTISHASTSHVIPPQQTTTTPPIDVTGPSTSTLSIFHGMDNTSTYYVPQHTHVDEPMTPYWGMPQYEPSLSALLDSDIGIGYPNFTEPQPINDTYRPNFNVSPIPYQYRSGDSSSTTSSTRPSFNLNYSIDDNEETQQVHETHPVQNMRRDRRHRQRHGCGTGSHF
ncbi:hypothetical protein DH2020_035848 [Rehmannia glutinosa]|uniref:Uncharacterized protein n=1 Tax=Rehmannia glutinosa TaxID=99300 RepID=A0ABR0V6I9_REHGL